MSSRRGASAAGPAATAAAAVVMFLLAVPAYGQKRLCQTPTPTLDGGRCTAERSVCEVRLEIGYRLTLTKSDSTGLFVQNYSIHSQTDRPPLTEEELEDVVIADGVQPYRLVTVINGSMPGPCLKFFTNQTMKFHVVNNLPSESLAIHWHGLDMFDNSYMDGVAFVSQCPIQPGATFVYTVKARQPGSYWYHSHMGAQRSMGILGPLVVHDPKADAMPERVMVLQDWNHDFTSDRVELGSYEFNGTGGKMEKLKATMSLDGAKFSAFPFHSGLINGRGRNLTTSGGFAVESPLEVFEVEQGVSYRFRVIGAGVIHPFRVSVERHRMTVVASDAHDFEPVAAESFIINPGERFDFILVANQSVNNYMILAETLEHGLPINGAHVAEAVLHYSNAPAAIERMAGEQYLPLSGAARGCLDSDPCVVINCPYSYYPEEDNTRCVHLGDLRTRNVDGRAPDSSNVKQIFLNFGFPDKGQGPPSINGIEFQRPPLAAILHPDSLPNSCSSCGPDQLCQCTHTVKLERNRVHQIVLLNMGSGTGVAHPIHIHGYSFYVVKMGYPVYDNSTGEQMKDNEDVACEDNFCNVARWRNQSWEPSDVQGLNLLNPVRKDTIILPAGGYVIVRLKADNPGMWFVHCHIELHHLGGMALILDGSQGGLPAPPPGFPDCGNFPTASGDSSSSCGGYELWQIVTTGVLGVFLGLAFGIAGTCACVWCRNRGKK